MGNTVGRQFYISSLQEEIINGSLLGDGRLECRSTKGTARLRVHHGWKQKEFVFWKYRMLRNLVSSPPKKTVCWKNPETGEDYHSWYFHTLTLKGLGRFYQDFYPKGNKRLPGNVENLITELSLAVWVMDDGCGDSKSLILNSHNFSLQENERLTKVLESKFNLHFNLNKDRDKWRLRLVKKDFSRFRDLVEPYIIPSMRYKIVPVETEP